MEQTNKQNQSDKKLAEVILIKPYFFLSYQPMEKFFKYWKIKYARNPNFVFGSQGSDKYFLIDKKTIKQPILFYTLFWILYCVSFSAMMIYYMVLFTLPVFLLAATNQLLNFSWTNFSNIATIFVYIYYFMLAYLVLLKTWAHVLIFAGMIAVIGFIIWVVFFPPSFSPPSLSDQMGIVILLLVFIAIGVYNRR